MPPARSILKLLAFTVPAALGAAAAQPVLAAVTGTVGGRWAASMAGPGLAVAVALVIADRLSDRGLGAPPWYSAYLLFPGAFLLAGAASMCLIGAFVELPAARLVCWELLAMGAATWVAGLVWVRAHSSGER
ncbi:MAG TPA: hypothetical protein VF134_00135 [Candidatus Dormibacteraeota bacterium]